MSLSLGIVELFPPNTTAQTDRIEPDFCAGDSKYAQICEMLGIRELMVSVLYLTFL